MVECRVHTNAKLPKTLGEKSRNHIILLYELIPLPLVRFQCSDISLPIQISSGILIPAQY